MTRRLKGMQHAPPHEEAVITAAQPVSNDFRFLGTHLVLVVRVDMQRVPLYYVSGTDHSLQGGTRMYMTSRMYAGRAIRRRR